jgi:hypothetical protein
MHVYIWNYRADSRFTYRLNRVSEEPSSKVVLFSPVYVDHAAYASVRHMVARHGPFPMLSGVLSFSSPTYMMHFVRCHLSCSPAAYDGVSVITFSF